MTRTLAADAVMSACARIASRRPARARGRHVSRRSAYVRRASHGTAATSCRFGPGRPALPHQHAAASHPPCPRQPVHIHPLYLYLLERHAATHCGWSFDPGRDILCILISPLRWLQWP
jgi:hypothetical protein